MADSPPRVLAPMAVFYANALAERDRYREALEYIAANDNRVVGVGNFGAVARRALDGE